MSSLFAKIAVWGLHLVSTLGYGGLFVSMTLESAAIPIPSEVIVPFSGFLAAQGRFDFWTVVILATLANLTGSIIIYFIGYYGGRPALQKYGKYVLLHHDDIERIDGWLQKHGGLVAFFSRILPGTRTFSSLIIGAAEIPFRIFFWYTLAGSFAWNLPWTYVGYAAGENWNSFEPYIRRFDYLIAAFIILAVLIYIARHLRRRRKHS